MFTYKKIYKILKTSTPTGDDLSEMIYGKVNYYTRGRVRRSVSYIREKYNVSVVADQYGRYHTCIPQYKKEDGRTQNFGKLGRPRHYE